MNNNSLDDNTSENIHLCNKKIIKKEQQIISNNTNYNCVLCNYTSFRKNNYNRHLLTPKHLDNMTKKQKTHICSICNFECSKISGLNLHFKTKKHIQNMKMNEINKMGNVEAFKNEVISTLMFQLGSVLEENNKNILAEQTRLMVETQSKLMAETQTKLIQEIANKPTNTNNITNNNNHNQTNNQQFNLNMFLNETCKDAMNLSEFIENMQVTMEDMEKTGELGFAKGMSRIIMNNLNAIDVCKRPIHCSDVKRETLYVKNNGVWEKETDERNKTKEIIYKVSCLNVRQLLKWRDLPRNKGYEKSDHVKNDEFTNLVIEINKMREEEFDKIITSISKHVAIDKERVKMSGYLN